MSKQYIFKKKLLSWSIKNTREYSWRNTQDPWKILLLEVISQQTQLDRANKYYQKFIKKFPSPSEMSKASKKEILKMWSGLGYNSRAIRLHDASKFYLRAHLIQFIQILTFFLVLGNTLKMLSYHLLIMTR